MDILSYLNSTGYDFCKTPVGDGVTDDTEVIQLRLDCGLSPIKGGGTTYLISKSLTLKGDVILDGNR